MSIFRFLSGPQGRIAILCVLSLIAFGYAWWNERSRPRPSKLQKRIAQTLLVAGLIGSLWTTIWASIDAARYARQLQNTHDLAFQAAEHSNVASLSAAQERQVEEAMHPYASLRVDVTCDPGASAFCKPLVEALESARLDVHPELLYHDPGGYLDAKPFSFPHQATVTALPAAYGAAEALIGVLKSLGIDAGGPDPSVWTPDEQAAYATSIDPYPLRVRVVP
jgi:hypothetical protein